MKITPGQLPAALNERLLSCYFVTGDEHLLVQEALDAVRATARHRGFTAREIHVAGPGFDWQALAASAGNLSLFAERRILELRLPTGKPGRDGSAAIIALLEKLGDDLVFVVSAPKLDRTALSAKWVEALDACGGVVQVWPVDARELPAWIGARMRRGGLLPDREAVAMIAERVEGNLLAAHQEVEKLGLLLGEGRVTGADVERAVADSSRYDVFKLTDAAVAGDAGRALRILGGLREEGVEPPLIVWALARELRVLAKLAHEVAAGIDLGVAMRKARVWQSRQGVLRASIRRHAPDDFYRLLKLARQIDAATRGRLDVDPWQLAMELVFDLATGRRARAA
ncbi:MAG TPA: DNA polymerase III subunit delta [Woeseiaceae bacterium]|nr:DNA polymerase III subunit delta [Woeseiaceae bacterium]